MPLFAANKQSLTQDNMAFKPGNKLGRGRPPRPPELKELAQGATKKCVKTLIGLLDDPKVKPSNKLQAAKTLLEFG